MARMRNRPDIEALLNHNIDEARGLQDVVRQLAPALEAATNLVAEVLLGGQKLMCCGNGGSAADAAHFTAEIAGRYVLDRPGFPALDLTAEHSLLTALINDFPPVEVFARQVKALGQRGDVLVVFTTSGNSANILAAMDAAREKHIHTIAFLGRDGGQARSRADVQLIVPSKITARIQEIHLLLYHTLCEAIDPLLANHAKPG